MDISTYYLSFQLDSPLVPGASPLTGDVSTVRRLEDAGAPMIIMHSIFQEQLEWEQYAFHHNLEHGENAFAESLTYLPRPDEFRLGPEEYLEQLARIKAAVKIPVVASLNGRTHGGWTKFAQLIHSAGADALELNIYEPLIEGWRDAASVESDAVAIVRDVCRSVSFPVAVKLSPFYTNLQNFALQLCKAGARGLVLFNRFYQPDIDLENLEVVPRLELSTSAELLPRLRAVAALSGTCPADLAVTGGVHTATDVLKSVMAGASIVQMASALLLSGPRHLRTLRTDLCRWLEDHNYDSLVQARGSMSLQRTDNPAAYERANYTRMLQSWTRQ